MNFLRTLGTELLGLFVEDWAFALLILAWVLLFALLGPHLPRTPAVAVLFFAGFALLTLVSVRRKAK